MVNATHTNAVNESSVRGADTAPAFPGDLFVKNVVKSFGVTKALNGVSFTGHFGEIHAIIGGNGCGKSTLAKVLAGVLPIDSGKVSIRGRHPSTPGESRSIGVAMVFQEVLVADESSVVDNLFVGSDGFFTKSMSDKEKQRRAKALMSELSGEDVDPLQPAGTLPLSIKAWITIARGFLCEPDLLILDESSAALDFDSTERLFQKMRDMRDQGTAIIIVTHRIAELIRISDRCTVMRDGKDVGVLEKEEITEENLLRLMTGGKASAKPKIGDAHKSTSTQDAIKTTNLKVWADSELVNFSLKKGEIVGITGLDGHGQDDFVRILAGVRSAESGELEASVGHGHDMMKIRSLAQAKECKIGFVSGDRKAEGILPNLSILENLLIPLYTKSVKVPGLRIIDWLGLRDVFDWEVERLAIKTGPEENLITSLSGGNQQKVMLGRAFAQEPSSLMLLDPARGIDLQTKRDLYQQLRDFASEGNSVVYMSSELEEFIGFCSRVLVFRNGSVFEEFVDDKVEGIAILESMFGRHQGGGSATTAAPVSTPASALATPSTPPTPKPSPINNGDAPVSDVNISEYFKPQNTSDSNQSTASAKSTSIGDYAKSDEALFNQLSGQQDSELLLQPLPEQESHVAAAAVDQTYKTRDEDLFSQLIDETNTVTSDQRFVPSQSIQQYNENDEQAFAHLQAESSPASEPEHKQVTESDKTTQPTGAKTSSSAFSDKDMLQFNQLMAD